MTMSVAQAAEIWEKSKREMDRLKPQLEASAEVLKDYFERTGKANYRGRISCAELSRNTLDQKAVKAELGERLPKFMKHSTYRVLSLLKP